MHFGPVQGTPVWSRFPYPLFIRTIYLQWSGMLASFLSLFHSSVFAFVMLHCKSRKIKPTSMVLSRSLLPLFVSASSQTRIHPCICGWTFCTLRHGSKIEPKYGLLTAYGGLETGLGISSNSFFGFQLVCSLLPTLIFIFQTHLF